MRKLTDILSSLTELTEELSNFSSSKAEEKEEITQQINSLESQRLTVTLEIDRAKRVEKKVNKLLK